MKTSNKLLLGMFSVIILSLTTFICIGRYYYLNIVDVKQSGVIAEETRTQQNFSNIKVEGNIAVILIDDAQSSVLLKGDKNYLKNIETSVKDGELLVKIPFDVKPGQQIEAIISTAKFETISCSNGVVIKSQKVIASKKLILQFDTGVSGSIEINAEETTLNCSTGADIELKGNTNTIDINATTGVALNASKLMAHKAIIAASMGSVLNTAISDEISGSMSTGVILSNTGNAVTNNLQLDTGASFSRK
jgi:hypothetical protein